MHPISSAAFLGQPVHALIDRPLGSRHPRHSFPYPLNYGYVPGVPSGDGEDLDVYVLGVEFALTEFDGVCIAVIHRLTENDDKLVLAVPGCHFTPAEIRALTDFQEQWFPSELWLASAD